VVAFSIIRNGITNGYPFVEAYGSWLDTCRRIVILDGESTDGTREALDALAAIDDRVVVESRPWPVAREGGGAIAEFTNLALSLARPSAGTLVYLQADELYPESLRRQTTTAGTAAIEFAGCVNFWNSFDTVVANEFPMRYVRAFPADASVESIGDGFSFELGDLPVRHSPDLILHYGWCFPGNILRKHVSHARLYRENVVYRGRGILAAAMLRAGSVDPRLLDALAPEYRPAPYAGEHPPAVRHLLGMQVYDPEPGLALLEGGAVW
jgi:glycosyltransferase involved in cell wall biosynthesis